MINKVFWTKVAEKWRMDNDGINIPKVEADVSLITDEDLIPFDSITDDEIDDILADLGLDI